MNRLYFLLLTILAAAPADAGTLYGVTAGNPGAIYTIDKSTGAATPGATLHGAAPQTYWSGLEFFGGLLYGIGFDAAGASDETTLTKFVSIDPATGLTTIRATVPNFNTREHYYALAVNPAAALFYSYNDAENQLYSITTGGLFTPVGAPGGLDWIDALAFDAASGLLYGVTDEDKPDVFDLYSVNPLTGTQTLIGALGVELGTFSGLALDRDTGTLYLSTAGEGTATSFYTVNKATGAATLFGSADGLQFTGLAAQPVPEPSTVALAGSVLAALLWRRRR